MKYDIVNIINNSWISTCKDLDQAKEYLKEFERIDKELQKYYNWTDLPKYKIIESEDF